MPIAALQRLLALPFCRIAAAGGVTALWAVALCVPVSFDPSKPQSVLDIATDTPVIGKLRGAGISWMSFAVILYWCGVGCLASGHRGGAVLFGLLANAVGIPWLILTGAGPALILWFVAALALVVFGSLTGSAAAPTGPTLYRPKPARSRGFLRRNPFGDAQRAADEDPLPEAAPADPEWAPVESASPQTEAAATADGAFGFSPLPTRARNSDRPRVRQTGTVVATGLYAAALLLPADLVGSGCGAVYLLAGLVILITPLFPLFIVWLANPAFLFGLFSLAEGNGTSAWSWGIVAVVLGFVGFFLVGANPASVAWLASLISLAVCGHFGGDRAQPRPADRHRARD